MSYIPHQMTQFFAGSGRERDTQQEISYTKHAVTNILHVTATLSRVNETSRLNAWSK